MGCRSLGKSTMPHVFYKPNCHYQNFSPLANGVYPIVINNKTPLQNGNCPITNLITEMGVANTVGLSWLVLLKRYTQKNLKIVTFIFLMGFIIEPCISVPNGAKNFVVIMGFANASVFIYRKNFLET